MSIIGCWIGIKLTRLAKMARMASRSTIVGMLGEPGYKFAPFVKTMFRFFEK